jgi:hypothetical protein
LDIRAAKESQVMKLETRAFELYEGKYKNLIELARAMWVHPSHVYRVKRGECRINETFIVGVMQAFPTYKLEELFSVAQVESENGQQE